MATLSTIHPTLLDLTKRLDPNGKIDMIAEILTQTNEILTDMVWVEGNMLTGHRSTIRSGLPTPTWRKLYGGVQPTVGKTTQVVDSCGMLEDFAEVDKALADFNGNTAAFRLSEDYGHIEAFAETIAGTVIYGNEATASETFTGFSPRFNDRSAANGENIICFANPPDGSDNSSIWLVVWGIQTVHGIIPQGSKAGLQMEDLGAVTIENVDGNGGRMRAYRTHYRWDAGLCVRDWRYIVRIQYDQEDLTKNASSGPDLIDLMTQAIEQIPNINAGRPAFYMNRRAKSFLRRQIANKVVASTLTMDQVAGRHVMMLDGIPCRRVDQILNTEAAVA
jgi:hypothetical protein